jgi:multidrug resistance protein, MATE family
MKRTRLDGWKKILINAWPLIIANSFWNLQLTIDRIFLGQFSTDALGAAMAVMGLFWVPMALIQQTASYSMTFVAQYFGAKQFEKIGPSIWHAIYLGVAGGLAVLLLIPCAHFIFAQVGHSTEMQKLEVEYFIALCFSALPTAIVAAVSGFYTGLGKSQMVMWINGVGLIANVIFDYIMIFGNFGFPAMGIAGAGYATALANYVGAAFGIWMMFRSDSGEFNLRAGWKWSSDLCKRYVRYGIPSGMQWALEGLAFTIFLVFVGRMQQGDAALASSGIVVTVMMLAVLPAFGVAQAVSVLVGQHLGEGKPELAEEDTWSGLQVAAMYIVTIALTFYLFPAFYLSWFETPEQAAIWNDVKVMVPFLLMFVGFFVCFDSMNLVFSFALKGAGDTRFVTLVALIVPWPLMVFPTWYFSQMENAIYYAWGAASFFIVFQAFVFLSRFLGGKWKKMSVIR